jgi:hypothetical protein
MNVKIWFTYKPRSLILMGNRNTKNHRLVAAACASHSENWMLRYDQGGIPTVPPPKLALRLPRLPPILCRSYQTSVSSCSKAPLGSFRLASVHSFALRLTTPLNLPAPGTLSGPEKEYAMYSAAITTGDLPIPKLVGNIRICPVLWALAVSIH